MISMTVSKKKYIYLSWLITYLLILLIPVSISAVVWFKSYKIIEEQALEYNTIMLENMKKHIDSKLSEINNFAVSLSIDTNLPFLSDVKEYRDIYASYTAVSRVNEFNSFINKNIPNKDIIENCSIFFYNNDFIWYNYALHDKQSFIEYNISNGLIPNETVEMFYDQSSFPAVINYHDGNGRRRVALVYQLPTNSYSHKASIAFFINPDYLYRQKDSMQMLPESMIYMIDNNNTVLFSTEDSFEALPLLSEGRDLLYETNGQYKRFIVNAFESGLYPWKYVSVVPEAVFSARATSILNFMLVCFLLCAVIGTALILFLIKKNYNPLSKLLKLVSSSSAVQQKNVNEFQYIYETFTNIYKKNISMTEKMQEQQKMMHASFLSYLLKGYVNDVQGMLEALDLTFSFDHFVVSLFFIAPDKSQKADAGILNAEYWQLYQNFILPSFTESEQIRVYATEVENITVLIFNISSCLSDCYKEVIGRNLRSSKNEIKNRLGVSCIFTASGIVDQADKLPVAYQDAFDGLEYHILGAGNDIIFTDEMVSQDNDFKYTFEDEFQLTNSIRAGDYQKAESVINTIFYNNFAEQVVPVYMAKFIVHDIVSCFIKVLNQNKLLSKTGVLSEKKLTNLITKLKTTEEMKEELLSTLRSLCKEVAKQREDMGMASIVNKVDEYIDMHYREDIGIARIAEEIHINPKTLSTLYKGQKNQSIIDGIHKKRISETKKIISETNVNINTLASSVGYINANTLIRVFKKYEGITPGQFKELNDSGYPIETIKMP